MWVGDICAKVGQEIEDTFMFMYPPPVSPRPSPDDNNDLMDHPSMWCSQSGRTSPVSLFCCCSLFLSSALLSWFNWERLRFGDKLRVEKPYI